MADTLAVVVLSKEAQNARYFPLSSAKNCVARFYALILFVGARGRYFSLFIILIYMKANVVDLDIESKFYFAQYQQVVISSVVSVRPNDIHN